MSYYTEIQKTINHIEYNLKSEIELANLSHLCGFSIPHLYRVFKAMTGYTIMEYARKRRLSEACYELMTSRRTILDIAIDFGYDSHEGFSRSVRKSNPHGLLFS